MPIVALELLNAGRQLPDPVLFEAGFSWEDGMAGCGSGGAFASGQYVRGELRLEVHSRFGLGEVRYHCGPHSVTHSDYMRYLGHYKEAQYPGFSEDPVEGFRYLAHDLAAWCQDFLRGSGSSIILAERRANYRSTLSGFAKLEES